MEGASKHPTKSTANSHIQLELDHTSVWYMQGDNSNAKALDYYPSIDTIF